MQSFETFIAKHKDEITALQIILNRPYQGPCCNLRKWLWRQVEGLRVYASHPRDWEKRVADELWQAYEKLSNTHAHTTNGRRILSDLVSLVRYAMHQENELVPYPEKVMANFRAWMGQQESVGPASAGQPRFTDEQRWWLEKMAEHIASNLGIEAEDFGYTPFDQRGGLGRVHQLFGAELPKVIDELNRELAA